MNNTFNLWTFKSKTFLLPILLSFLSNPLYSQTLDLDDGVWMEISINNVTLDLSTYQQDINFVPIIPVCPDDQITFEVFGQLQPPATTFGYQHIFSVTDVSTNPTGALDVVSNFGFISNFQSPLTFSLDNTGAFIDFIKVAVCQSSSSTVPTVGDPNPCHGLGGGNPVGYTLHFAVLPEGAANSAAVTITDDTSPIDLSDGFKVVSAPFEGVHIWTMESADGNTIYNLPNPYFQEVVGNPHEIEVTSLPAGCWKFKHEIIQCSPGAIAETEVLCDDNSAFCSLDPSFNVIPDPNSPAGTMLIVPANPLGYVWNGTVNNQEEWEIFDDQGNTLLDVSGALASFTFAPGITYSIYHIVGDNTLTSTEYIDDYCLDEIQIDVSFNDCYKTYDQNNYTVGNSGVTYWNQDNLPLSNVFDDVLQIKESLTIASGATLAIPEGIIVEFDQDARITVEAGAKLILEGCTLTSSCPDKPWWGIELQGNSNLNQYTESNQGVVIMNDALVENAKEGVALIGHLPDGNFDWGTSGGILKATNSTFYNCRRGAEFISYQNFNNLLPDPYAAPNLSYFKNCTFEVDDNFNTLHGNHPIRGITFWDVDKVKVEGCTFKNSMTDVDYSDANGLRDGIAMTVWEATMRLKGRYTGASNVVTSQQSEQDFDRNEIIGFDRGVYVRNIDELEWVKIKRTDFDNNVVGAQVQGAVGSQIVKNHFDIPTTNETVNTEIRSSGLYMEVMHDFEVENNVFDGSKHPNNPNDGGLVVQNLGFYENLIYGNVFDNLGFATLAYENNAGFGYKAQGLDYKCNDFGQQSKNSQDMYVHNYANIDPYQGIFSANASDPAGNRFSENPDAGTYGHIYICNPLFNIAKYYHHTEFFTDPSDSDQNKVDREPTGHDYETGSEACPKDISTELEAGTDFSIEKSGKLSAINSLRSEISYLEGNYNTILNGGIRPQIMDALLDPMESSLDVRNLLVQGSPYLDDDVLISAINRDPALNQWHLTEALVWNAPLSQAVLNALNAQMPLSQYLYSLVTAVDGSSQRLLLELEIKAKQERLQQAEGDYMRLLFEDPDETAPYGKVIDLFNGVNTSRGQRYTIAAKLKQDKPRDTDAILNNYLGDPNEDHYVAFKTVEIALYDAGRNWFQMNAGELATIQSIATDQTKEGWQRAQTILDLIGDNSPGSFAMAVNNSTPPARMAAPSKDDFDKAPKLLEAYPKPADTEIYVMAQLPDDFSNSSLHIYDVSGRLIQSYPLQKGVALQRIGLETYHTGVYFMELIVDDNRVENLQFHIIH